MTKTYSTLALKVGGDAFTEAMWDTYIRDNLNNLLIPACCIVSSSVDLTITNNTVTSVLFDTEEVDTDAMHSTATNKNRVNTPTSGVYYIASTIAYDANATGIRWCTINANGVDDIAASQGDAVTGAGNGTNMNTEGVALGGSTEYFETQAFQTSGGNLLLLKPTIRMGVVWLGRPS